MGNDFIIFPNKGEGISRNWNTLLLFGYYKDYTGTWYMRVQS